MKPGYWRVNDLSGVFTNCEFRKNCVGGNTSNLCLEGHSGALCGSCDSTA